jgi:hypothetical protein
MIPITRITLEIRGLGMTVELKFENIVEVESNFESQWKWNGIESKLVEVESN